MVGDDFWASPPVNEAPEAEVLGQGREPGGLPRAPRPVPRSVRAVGYVAIAGVAAAAVWAAARPAHQATTQAAAKATTVPVTVTHYPSQDDPLAGLPVYHELSVSTAPGDRSFIAFAGHVLLFLRITYSGTAQVRVVDGRVPQAGAYPDAGAGGLTAGTTANVPLRHGVPTEVFVRTRVDCTTVLAAPAVHQLELMTQSDNGDSRAQTLDVSALSGFWDEARHAACEPPDAQSAIAVSASNVRSVRAVAGGEPEVDAEVSLHDAAGFDAVVRLLAPESAALTLGPAALSSSDTVVEGGGTSAVHVRWAIRDCSAADNQPAPMLALHVVVSDREAVVAASLGGAFQEAWAYAVLRACE